MSGIPKSIVLNVTLFSFLFIVLGIHYTSLLPPQVDIELSFLAGAIGLAPVILSAFRSLAKRRISMDLLASVALVFSLIAQEWISAIFIALMLTAARIFQDWSDNQARRSMKSLLKLRPENVKVERNGELFEMPFRDVREGDIVVVEIGKRIAIDGTVIKGEGSVDESSLTGESLPVTKEVGSRVYSSTLVTSGHIHIKVEKVGKNTTLEQIIELVENSQISKPKAYTIADKFSHIYLITILISSAALYYFTGNLSLVLSVVLVVCADDVAVAVPLTFLTAIGFAAKHGVIVKGNNYLEIINNAKVMLIDKTGTLTKGALRVERIGLFGKSTHEQVLTAAAAASQESDHPICKAIAKYANSHDITLSEAESFEEVSGRGIKAIWRGKSVLVGRRTFLKENKINISEVDQKEIQQAEEEGLSVTVVAIDGKTVGFFGIADELKSNSRSTIEELKQLGVEKVVMITGDNERVAKKTAGAVGIDEYHANVLPEEKVNVVKKYLSKRWATVMVGDGVNDAAALSLADVGVAMGKTGYDVAIESADIILMKDDLARIPFIIRLSRRIRQIVIQDFWIWCFTNVVGLFLVFSGVIGPPGAAAYNFITDFLPLFNSLKVLSLYSHRDRSPSA